MPELRSDPEGRLPFCDKTPFLNRLTEVKQISEAADEAPSAPEAWWGTHVEPRRR